MKKPVSAAVAFESDSESDDSAPSPHTFRTAVSGHHDGSRSANSRSTTSNTNANPSQHNTQMQTPNNA